MASGLTLIGFEHSVYTWVVRFAFAELGLSADYIEANPFAAPPDPTLTRYTRLNRVPVLLHDAFRLTETRAILHYLNDLRGRPFTPSKPKARAQMEQIIGIVDADVYPVLVRQVFSHGFYLTHIGHQPDPQILAAGLQRATTPLAMLDDIAQKGRQLTGDTLSLADLHLAPMIAYFSRVPQGAACLQRYPALSQWWQTIAAHPTLRATDPL